MEKQVFIFLSLILCVYAKSWYLASNNDRVKEIFKTQITRKQDKINNNTTSIADHKNYSTIRDYFLPSVQDFKPYNQTQISNLLYSSSRKPMLQDVVKTPSRTPDLCINNSVQNSNIIKVKRPKRKIFQRRRVQRPKRINPFNKNRNAHSRFLDVFEVVEFNHEACFSVDGLEGTCLHEYDCQKVGGVTMGTCADGYGTCCVILFTCDDRSSSSSGWFTNPGFPTPSSERLSCTFILDKYTDQVQQIRLDFMSFEILPPTLGTCEQDQFLVTGQNVNNVIPILCGINTGQHVYIEISDMEGPLVLSFQTITEEKRLFSIKVTQIISSDNLRAPSGCLQYFKEEQGYLESFNYRETSEIGITRIPSYLNNLNYAICIERAKASCSITYNNVGDMQIMNYDTEGLPVIPPRQAGVEIFDCPSDWLLISAVRLCGERLNDGSILQDFTSDAPITDIAAGPIIIWFRTDGIYTGRGFKLKYQQNSCTI